MNQIESKIQNAINEAAEKTKIGETISIDGIVKNIDWTEADKEEIGRALIKRAVIQLVRNGLNPNMPLDELAAEISRQIVINGLSDELDAHAEGDVFVRIR